MTKAILVPGFNGTARQPLLVKLVRALKNAGIDAKAITLRPGRPKPDLGAEIEQLRKASKGASVLVGRSFGGRVCARLAVEAPMQAVVLLGFPVRPPGKRRPLDEAALKALRCPTLILQGSADELGSPAVLRRLLRENPFVTLEVVEGAGHGFGKHEAAVIARTAQWLSERLATWVKEADVPVDRSLVDCRSPQDAPDAGRAVGAAGKRRRRSCGRRAAGRREGGDG